MISHWSARYGKSRAGKEAPGRLQKGKRDQQKGIVYTTRQRERQTKGEKTANRNNEKQLKQHITDKTSSNVCACVGMCI